MNLYYAKVIFWGDACGPGFRLHMVPASIPIAVAMKFFIYI